MGAAIPQVITFDRASGAKVLDGSLAFSGVNQKLERTPGSTGNLQTWTWSGWVKIFAENQEHSIFSAHTGSSDRLHFRLSSGQIQFAQNTGSWDFDIRSKAYLRDIGWYHIVAIADFTNSTQNDRARLYVNGERQPLATNTLPSNTTTNTIVNAQKAHYIGEARSSTDFFGRMAEVYLIDGQALEPENFGFTDPLTNNWKPKEYEGTFPHPSVNDGTTWSSSVSGPVDSSYPLSNAFGGTIGSSYSSGTRPTVGNTLTFDISSKNLTVAKVRLNTFLSVANGNATLQVNDTDVTTNLSDGDQTHEITINGQLNNVKWSYDSGNGPYVYMRGIEVDLGGGLGYELLTDGLNNTGVNSFYLPMDGNSPIGEDKSGNENDWTPILFGGSAGIDKATGALPILNTTQGGTRAAVGVRTDANHANLFLAAPLLGSDRDVSNLVNSASTEKVATNSSVDASSTQSNFYGGSHHWSANSDSLTYAQQGDELVFGTGDFTIEFWYFDDGGHSGTGGRTYLFDNRIGGSVTGDPPTLAGWLDGAEVNLYITDGGGLITYDGSVENKWHHYAAVRSGSTVTLYHDGVARGTMTSSTNFTNNGIGVGRATDANYGFAGYMQDFRIYKGVAKYTSNFVPAATNPDILPDTPSGVSGSSKLTKITDGAVSFDGTDYLTVADGSNNFSFGTGAYTVEGYLYPTTLTGNGDANPRFFCCGTPDASSNRNQLQIVITANGRIRLDTNSTNYLSTAGDVVANKWTHIAVARDGSGNLKAFVDGRQVISQSSVNNDITNDDGISLGIEAGYSSRFTGFMSNVRILKGTALYTSAFTPPTAPLTNVTNTKLLCCQSNIEPGRAAVAPNVSGINNGTQWSAASKISAGSNASNKPLSNGFDGSTSTAFEGDTSGATVTVPIVTSISAGGVRVYAAVTGGNPLKVLIKNGSTTEETITGSNSGGQYYASSSYSGPITSLVISRTGRAPEFNAIEIGGTVLTDPIDVNGDSAATNFSPFNTDINAVLGQETGYASLNPLIYGASTLTDGNLTATAPSGNTHGRARSTLSMDTSGTGKFYFEATLIVTGGTYPHIGVIDSIRGSDQTYVGDATNCFSYFSTGNKQLEGATGTSYGDSFTVGDTIGCSLDCGSGELRFYKNGVDQGVAKTITAEYDACFAVSNFGSNGQWKVNFGQKPFKFPPPDGFQPLNAANVRPVKIISRPDQYVGVTTYIGTGSSGIRIDTGIKADLILLKDLSENRHWGWFDTQRGKGKIFYPADGSPSSSTTADILNFLDDGFTYATDDRGNTDDSTYAVWSWKAGGYIDNNGGGFFKDGKDVSNATNAGLTGGDITPSSASIGTKQGFSIVRYAGTNNASAQTIPHGLSQKPDFMVIKQETDNNTDWIVYFSALGATKFFKFNSTNNADVSSDAFNDTEPTASLFTVGSGYNNVNRVSRNFSSYHWHNVPGLQRFGKYTGNGQTDGTFVELGFRPKIIWIRPDKDGENWMIIDSERYKFNKDSMEKAIFSTTKPSLDTGSRFDFLSNGFKFKNNGNNGNASGVDYYYCAWADVPSFDLYGGGANAR